MAIYAKGRNGYFKMEEGGVTVFGDSRTALLEIWSMIRGKSAPITLDGPICDIESFLSEMLEKLRCQKTMKGIK